MDAIDDKPIIVRRVKKKKHGHHGGAWKVAFADFAVAMMAFFLVLWLMEATTVEEKMAISGYFNDPSAFTEGGSPYVIDLEGSLKKSEGESEAPKSENENNAQGNVIDEQTVEDLAQQIEYRKFSELRRKLQTKIEENPELEKYKDQIIMEITDDGLQIQIVDKDSRPMFDSGSDKVKGHMADILEALGTTIGRVPNSISISGHTDAAVFTERSDYSNWELSAERANSARRALQKGGIQQSQISQVVGLSSSVLFDKDDPLNPINRRISILVLKDESAARIKRQQEGVIDESKLPEDKEFDAGELPATEQDVINQSVDATEGNAETPVEDSFTITVDDDAPARPAQQEQAFEQFEQLRKDIGRRQGAKNNSTNESFFE
ncbi:MAG: flagellar motor protein MotB [Pseudomonadales bacterium]|nr:flagellar motor protein MotB [Pseudomonadales bacterium]